MHIKTLNSDGSTYGVGMPVIAYFSKKISDGAALQKATTVTVNGKPVDARWYFEYSSANKGYPVEGHLRPQNYWHAHSRVHVDIAAKGVSAGEGQAFDDSLTLDFRVGARHIVTVDNSSHKVTVVSDGKKYGTFPTALGAPKTRTKKGIKVIMEQLPTVCMTNIQHTYHECGIKWDSRLTYDGEYLHSAPWNIYNIKHGINSSNGCTNLLPKDAKQLYHYLRVGDVVTYPNADGPQMQLGQGYGDWNLSWGQWQSGGLVSTT